MAANGSAEYARTSSDKAMNSSNGTNGVDIASRRPMPLEGCKDHALILASFRCMVADLCQQFGGGHPGGAMGMAAIGLALWGYGMNYSPLNPDWFQRDRFVLSNGHCCLFQYMFLHLTGYKAMTEDHLKSYHSTQADSLCPGHPEIEIEGIEVTTGPLGQGIANAVGMAMATEHLAATYNRPGYDVVQNMTFCTVGDACLQEGVALEAISLAGHWKLKSLVVLYDNNQVTCDGSADVANTEDVNAKMKACGWDVIDIEDGCYDVTGIVQALDWARNKRVAKPTFINCRTIIGVGSLIAGSANSHGAAFGAEGVRAIKTNFGTSPDEHFYIPQPMRAFFKHLPDRGQKLESEYKILLEKYAVAHPEMAMEFEHRRNGTFASPWVDLMPPKDTFSDAPTPGRKSTGAIATKLASSIDTFMVGTADLTPSVNLSWRGMVEFQHPDLKPVSGSRGDFTGRYIHWGIREHAMASISNGMSAYNPGTIIPITSSFFMFYIYAAPGIRMAALQGLHQIHIATHDSIGTGEDGPTHQPIELAALYRAMPNMLYIRPCDSEEAAGAFHLALEHKVPSMISVSRQNNPQYLQNSSREGTRCGAYVFEEDESAAVTIIGVGAEMKFAVEAKMALQEKYGVKARIVSMPCQRAFDAQPRSYKQKVFLNWSVPSIVIEAYSMRGWERYADGGYGMATFGHSLPGQVAYEHFGFSGENIASKIAPIVDEVREHGLACLRGDFRELNDGNWKKSLTFMTETT